MSDSEKEERFFQFWKKHVGFLLNVLPEEERQAHINNLEKKKGYDQHVQCVKWQRYLESYSPIVRFMLEECEKIGAHPLMECVKCDDVKSGGFDPELGIQFCENHLRNKQQLEDTMAHELVHAYDNQKFNVDWQNCLHHACSEVRAASLSGDCKFSREILRGNFRFTKHHQTCVKRRATLSLKQNKACAEVAQQAVLQVFASCFNDTRPFDEIY